MVADPFRPTADVVAVLRRRRGLSTPAAAAAATPHSVAAATPSRSSTPSSVFLDSVKRCLTSIAAVRAFNRFYTGQLGGPWATASCSTPHTLGEARVLYELNSGGPSSR